MKSDQNTLDSILAPYARKGCRYLLEADLDWPVAQGVFCIPESFYIDSTGHFNAVELVICYNQLSYVLFADALWNGRIKGMSKISPEDYKKLQLSNMLIVRMDNMRFHKLINATHPFRGTVRAGRITSRHNAYFAKTTYDFEDGTQTGEIDVALVMPSGTFSESHPALPEAL